jgi:NAD(P)H-dependent FMN reductase
VSLSIAIISGSTRPGRNGEAVAHWVHEQARNRVGVQYDVIDLADVALPFLDEPVPAIAGRYQNAHTIAWAEQIRPYDGFVFVTPEYNHSTSAVLKNALDFLYSEWNNKAAGFVSYGTSNGVRAIEHLRTIASELQIAHVRNQVSLSLSADFTDHRAFTPNERREQELTQMLDQLEAWAGALQPLRG